MVDDGLKTKGSRVQVAVGVLLLILAQSRQE